MTAARSLGIGTILLLAGAATLAAAQRPTEQPYAWWQNLSLCLSSSADTPAQLRRAERRRWRKQQAAAASEQAAELAP